MLPELYLKGATIIYSLQQDLKKKSVLPGCIIFISFFYFLFILADELSENK